MAADGYCLDGNRLKLQSGSYGGNGSVWYTEMADFSRVTAAASGSYGPDSWTVERKDCTTWTYGTTTGASVLLGSVANAWYVSQIADRAGNKIRFTYKAADTYTTGTTHPTKIEWTQTSAGSGSYLYSIEFSYTSNGNTAQSSFSGYVGGSEVRDTDLLASISVKNSTTTVRKYVLASCAIVLLQRVIADKPVIDHPLPKYPTPPLLLYTKATDGCTPFGPGGVKIGML